MTAELIRLNLGCGLQAPRSWVNVDRSPSLTLSKLPMVKSALGRSGLLRQEHLVDWPTNVRRMDVTKRLPFTSNSVVALYSSHMLEHLYFNQASDLLTECRRLLAPGGTIRLALPDAEKMARALVDSEDNPVVALEFSKALNMAPLDKPTVKQGLLRRFASAPHRWQPTEALGRKMLTQAGFNDARRYDYLCGELPGLTEVEHRPESLFLEAKG